MNLSSDRNLADRNDAIQKAITTLEKQYGIGAIMRLGDSKAQKVEVIPTGSPALDIAVGCGGYARGRVIEIYGPEASGKTTLTLHAIASCQAGGGIAAFIDAEHALDPSYAGRLGVNLDDLLVCQPDYGEQALEIASELVSSGAVDLIVIDSVAALVPKAELDGDMGELPVGLQARLMSQALRKLTGGMHRTGTCVIFINQLRQKIGNSYGPSETTTGGNALKYYASLRLDVRRIGGLKQGEVDIGTKARVKVVKNKLAPPFKQVEIDILFGRGISATGDLIEMGEARGIITKSGSWYAMGDERLGQGKEKTRDYLDTHPDTRTRLHSMILSAEGMLPAPSETPEA